MNQPLLTIGEVARRAGVATSTLRFYEDQGLLLPSRTAANVRRYPREALRRVAFVKAAQQVGLSLDEVRRVLASLPASRTPTRADWERVAKAWRPLLDARIAALERVRDKLTSCIGCGCLSLGACALFNRDDQAAAKGPGARYLLGDRPPQLGSGGRPNSAIGITRKPISSAPSTPSTRSKKGFASGGG
jgi:MerR family redox-sensitive transcriptional activator SoxR